METATKFSLGFLDDLLWFIPEASVLLSQTLGIMAEKTCHTSQHFKHGVF